MEFVSGVERVGGHVLLLSFTRRQLLLSKQMAASLLGHHNWIELPKFPFPYWSRSLELQNDGFIIVPQKYPDCDGDGIYKYANKKWHKIIDYNPDFESMCHSVEVDQDRKMIYVYDNKSRLHQFDLNKNKFKTTNTLFAVEKSSGDHPRILYVNNEIHIIGGRDSNKHLICNPETQEIDEIHRFSDIATEGLSDYEMIYVKAINSILMFGGESDDDYLDTIYRFSLSDRIWKRLETKLPVTLAGFGLTLKKCGQFVLILGGYGQGSNGDIYIRCKTLQYKKKQNINTFTSPMLYSYCGR